jgi:hypothetical protein
MPWVNKKLEDYRIKYLYDLHRMVSEDSPNMHVNETGDIDTKLKET